MNELRIRPVTIDDLDACCQIESECFSPEEAASRTSIETRIKIFPQGFWVAELNGQVVGQINSGATSQDDITDEAFKQLIGHDPEGHNLVVFSLSVLPSRRRQGIAAALLHRYITQAVAVSRRSILLLCKFPLIAYYERFGFENRGLSASTHGGVAWYEMALNLTRSDPECNFVLK